MATRSDALKEARRLSAARDAARLSAVRLVLHVDTRTTRGRMVADLSRSGPTSAARIAARFGLSASAVDTQLRQTDGAILTASGWELAPGVVLVAMKKSPPDWPDGGALG